MGNVTFTTLIIVGYIFIPGYLTRFFVSKFIDKFWLSNLFLRPFNFDRPFQGIFYCLGVGSFAHLIFLGILKLLPKFSWSFMGSADFFERIDFKEIFSIIGGGEYSDKVFDSISGSNFSYFVFYLVFLIITCLVVSFLYFLYLLAIKKIPPGWFLFYPPEFNGFSRKEFLNRNVFYWIDVATKTGNETTIYKGILSKVEYTSDGDLHLLYLNKCYRRILYCGDNRVCKIDSSSSENMWVKVEGDFMIIPNSEVLNLNIKLFGLKKYDLIEFSKQFPDSFNILLTLIKHIENNKIREKNATYKLEIKLKTSTIKNLQYLTRKSFSIKYAQNELKGTEEKIQVDVEIHDCFVEKIKNLQKINEQKRAKGKFFNLALIKRLVSFKKWLRNLCFFQNRN